MPAALIDHAPQRNLYRYLPVERVRQRRGPPVLLVPPLAAPAFCFDLRRGCSLAEHLLFAGREVYLVDYGEIEFADRTLGLEHWIAEVVPEAVRFASEDAGGRPLRLVGWSLGGIFALLAHAADERPADRRRRAHRHAVRLLARAGRSRRCGRSPPSPAGRGSRSSTGRSAARPRRSCAAATSCGHRQVRDEAVDDPVQPRRPRAARADRGGRRLHGPMSAYPGRTFGQLFHRFFRTNDLARGARAHRAHARPRRRHRPRCSRRGPGTGSRPSPRATTSPSWSRTPARCGSRPPRAATSACSPAARRAERPGRVDVWTRAAGDRRAAAWHGNCGDRRPAATLRPCAGLSSSPPSSFSLDRRPGRPGSGTRAGRSAPASPSPASTSRTRRSARPRHDRPRLLLPARQAQHLRARRREAVPAAHEEDRLQVRPGEVRPPRVHRRQQDARPGRRAAVRDLRPEEGRRVRRPRGQGRPRRRAQRHRAHHAPPHGPARRPQRAAR